MKETDDKKSIWLKRRREDGRKAYIALMKYYPLTLDDLPGETWKIIPKCKELYQVSNFGRVKSFHNGKSKILKPCLNRMGYLLIHLYVDGKRKVFLIHRLVALCFVSNPENKTTINHKDGHPLNCHVSNLEWVTPLENSRHAVERSLSSSGEDRPNAKITNQQALYIRENPDNLTGTVLAKKFGVDKATISEIQTGKKWKQIGGNIRHAKFHTRRISDDVRAQIRVDYRPNVRGCCSFLAKKYGVCLQTVLNILKRE